MSENDLPYSYVEYKTSGEEQWDITTGTRTLIRVFKGPWTDRYNFIQSYLTVTTSNGALVYGKAHPLDENAKPKNISISFSGATDIDTSSKFIEHDRAIITVEYGHYPYSFVGSLPEVNSDEPQYLYLTESFTSEVELLELNHNVMQEEWIDQTISIINKKHQIPLTYLNYTISSPLFFFGVTPEEGSDYDAALLTNKYYYDLIHAMALSGRVNASRIRSFSGLVFKPQTLLFQNYTARTASFEYFKPQENIAAYSVEAHFKYNHIGWTKVYDAKTVDAEVEETTLSVPPIIRTALPAGNGMPEVVAGSDLNFAAAFPHLFTTY